MNRSRLLGGICACLISSVSTTSQATSISDQGTWEATLQARDFDGNTSTVEGWYDTELGITWSNELLSGYGMSWEAANTWASHINIDGITGWRLPKVTPINGVNYSSSGVTGYDGQLDYGYNISAPGTFYAGSTASEMAHLHFNTLGNVAQFDQDGYAQPGWGILNVGPFDTLSGNPYWSNTQDATITSQAWLFSFGRGLQVTDYKAYNDHVVAWAVHDGDVGVAISNVPLPPALLLFGGGLLGLIGVARKTTT